MSYVGGLWGNYRLKYASGLREWKITTILYMARLLFLWTGASLMCVSLHNVLMDQL